MMVCKKAGIHSFVIPSLRSGQRLNDSEESGITEKNDTAWTFYGSIKNA
jgi:hypothetical protein